MRVVITGALGHVGSRLIRELASVCPGAEIILVDNLATQRFASLYELPAAGHYQFVEADILTADLPALFEHADAVIHLAAITHTATDAGLGEMERVNVVGTERVAHACLATGAALLFPSTTSVYGAPEGVVSEDCAADTLRPQSPYAGWKLQSEARLRALGERAGLRFVIFRMGTIFGPSVGMRFHTAVNQFCWRAVSRQPLEVWRTALHQYRPYLDLSDAVRAMLFVVGRRQFDGRVYNVLTVNATVQQVVETVSGCVPELRITYVDSPLMNDLSYYVDSTRFTNLGFEFNGSLAIGIGDTVAMLTTAQSRSAGLETLPRR